MGLYDVQHLSITAIVSIGGQNIENLRAESQGLRHLDRVGALLELGRVVVDV